MSAYQDMELTISRGRGRKRLVVVGKFTYERVSECNGYPFHYDLRGSDRDCGNPSIIQEPGAIVNHCGKFFSKEQIPMDGWLPIHEWWFV